MLNYNLGLLRGTIDDGKYLILRILHPTRSQMKIFSSMALETVHALPIVVRLQ